MKLTFVAVALATACFLGCSACERKTEVVTPVPAPQDGGEPAPITHTYSTRGIIESLPEAGKPTSELMIRHEAINDFVNGSREVVGMNAMTMPFPRLSEGVTLEGLAVGDKVAFSFTNTWSGPEGSRRPGWVIDAISELPAETELIFGKKATPPPPEPK